MEIHWRLDTQMGMYMEWILYLWWVWGWRWREIYIYGDEYMCLNLVRNHPSTPLRLTAAALARRPLRFPCCCFGALLPQRKPLLASSSTCYSLDRKHRKPLYLYMWAGLGRHGTGPQKHGPQRHDTQKHISNYGPCLASTCALSSAHGTTHN
jgi:hypothetical protein